MDDEEKQRNREEENRLMQERGYITDIYSGIPLALKEPTHLMIVGEFVYASGCNVFHWNDVAAAIYDALNKTFELVHFSIQGRDRHFLIRVEDYYLTVDASGYGTGDFIVFDANFPEEWKFKILRSLARTHCFDMRKIYLGTNTPDEERKLIEKINQKYGTVAEVIYDNIRSIQELVNFTSYLHALDYPEYGNNKEVLQKFATSDFAIQFHELMKKVEK